MKIVPENYNLTYNIGGYEFLAEIHRQPLFAITRLVRIRLTLVNSKPDDDSWERSIIVRHSVSGREIHLLIRSYLEEIDYFKLE